MRTDLFLLAAGLALVGCKPAGDPRLPLEGSVTLAGRPVPAGRIDFLPDTTRGGDGPAGFAAITAGRFDTRAGGRGVAAGPYLALVRGTDGKPGPADGEETGRPLFPTFTWPFAAEPDVTLTIEVTTAEDRKP